ncbi:MAG: cytochrome c oxidase subunit 3 [Actinobacteria bacterium]|nr:cytochrome c oxidase subunit 3 [Actinomycetota bacterium]
MAGPPLALPSGAGTGLAASQRRMTLPMAVVIVGAGVVMLMGGLVAAYLALKAATGTWPPKGTEFDNYTASTLTITALMAAVTIEWAGYSIRKGFRGQALFGFGITFALAVAFINALAYLINGFAFRGGASPYATVVYAMTGTAFVVAGVATFAVLLAGLRAVGHQLSRDNYHLMRATALVWHVALVAWLVVYYTIYITK